MTTNTQMRIPMLDLSAQHEHIADEIEAAVKAVLNGQKFILGPDVRALEQEIAAYCGCEHAIGCASGSDALLLALMALGIGEGDEVITTPFSFFATAGSVVRLGAKPVFVDIEYSTFNMDPVSIESAVTERTKAILPVHLFGQCADMDRINAIASKWGLAVIEDAAQAIGAEYRGKRAGSLGTMGCFSFYPSKNLGGAGDGGMITTNDPELAAKLRSLRTHGAKMKYHHDYVGINSRLDSLQAAILRVKFKYLDQWAQGRRQNAERYRKLFRDVGLVDGGGIELPIEAENATHVYNQFVVRARNRDDLQLHLRERGIGTEVYYPLALHLQPCFAHLGLVQGAMPVSEKATAEALALPVYPELGAAQQEYIVNTIADFYRHGTGGEAGR
jgi:dTDP-4-amino-4,6-dideoxygalactose transaminase